MADSGKASAGGLSSPSSTRPRAWGTERSLRLLFLHACHYGKLQGSHDDSRAADRSVPCGCRCAPRAGVMGTQISHLVMALPGVDVSTIGT